MKTNKSYTKRIRVTKNNKLVARKPGQNHYNAMDSGNVRRGKRADNGVAVPKRIKRAFLAKKSK